MLLAHHSLVKPCSIKARVQRLYNLSSCGSPTINPTTLARKLLSRNDGRHRKEYLTDWHSIRPEAELTAARKLLS